MSGQVDREHLDLGEVEVADQRFEILELRAKGVQQNDRRAGPRVVIAEVVAVNVRVAQPVFHCGRA